MNGQGQDRSPGVKELLAAGGGTHHGTSSPAVGPARSAIDVLPREVVVHPTDVEIIVGADLLADLHDPSLIISQGYVGPDRRRFDRSIPPPTGMPMWLRRTMLVVFLTTVVVVPLTMISVRSVPPAASSPGASQPQTPTTPKAKSGPHRHLPHVITASSQQIARAEAAYQKALARAGYSNASVPTSASATAPPAPTATSSQASQASQAEAATGASQHLQLTSAQSQQQTQRAAAAQLRVAAQAQAAEARAAAQAATAQRRAAAAEARAQAQAARSAAHPGGSGASGTSVSGGSTSTALPSGS